MSFKAIIFGASGMVGEGVLLEALSHDEVDSVLVIGRRPCRVIHEKLRELILHDFFDYSPITEHLTGYQSCFFCLGVSSVGMREQEYHRITYDLTIHAAGVLSARNPEMTFCYVSGAGTDSTEKGRLMWARVKGKTENHLAKLPFKAVYLFRPALLKPTPGQKNVKRIFKAVGLLYPLLKTLLPASACTLQELGRAMIRTVESGYHKQILEVRDISQLGRTG
jgi:uncharacterized protein YbjT (DUF2867 family)